MRENFFNIHTLSIHDVCAIIGVQKPDNCDVLLNGIATLQDATSSELSFLHNTKYVNALSQTQAAACLIQQEFVNYLPKTCVPIVVKDPYLALAKLLPKFYSSKQSLGISKDACISSDANIGKNCSIGSYSVIGQGVRIGDNCIIENNVTITNAVIGDNTWIKSGARIGQPGFGFVIDPVPVDILHIGSVIIGNNCVIGCNCTIDRGSIDNTVIGNYVRMDNMVHIAHNVHIGDFCIFAAQCGVAGSTQIGKGCVFGGQVGIAGHLVIGDGVKAAAQTGIASSVDAGAVIAGSPAIKASLWRRQFVMLKKMVMSKI